MSSAEFEYDGECYRDDDGTRHDYLPGMSCRDPVTGATFRHVAHDRDGDDSDGGWPVEQTGDPDAWLPADQCWNDVSRRAFAAGPDLTDITTAAVYAVQHRWRVYQPQTAGWCPECGPQTRVDEEGCCLACGATATGPGATAAVHALAEVERQKALDLASECDRLRRKLADLQQTGAEPATEGAAAPGGSPQ